MASITERNGKYRIRVSIYNNGKQEFKSITYTPSPNMTKKQIDKEVNRQAILFEEEIKNSINMNFDDLTLKDFMQRWFIDYAEFKLKKVTISTYRNNSNCVYELLGDKKVRELNPVIMQKFVSDLSSRGFSSSTIKNHVRLVSNVLNYGVKKRVLPYNPCIAVDYPRDIKKDKQMFDVEETKEFLRILNSENQNSSPFLEFFTVLIYTGARKSEILALTWDDVDLENGIISITKGYFYSAYHKESYIDTTKNFSSQRVIKISHIPIKALRNLKAMYEKLGITSNYIFVNHRGVLLNITAPNQFLLRFCKKYNLKKVNVHSFRHFAASAMIASGLDVASVQVTLGHSTPATTLSIYSHAFKDANVKASESIVKVLE